PRLGRLAPLRLRDPRRLPRGRHAGRGVRAQRRRLSPVLLRRVERAHRGGPPAAGEIPGGPPVSAAACLACTGQWPASALRIADLPTSVAYLGDDQFFPGWCVLVLRRHATELWQLAPAERGALMEDVTRLAQALGAAFDAVKLNYELLGNQIGHIHWHLIPRRADDPAPRAPAWTVAHAPRPLGAAETAERIARIRTQLGA